MNLLNRKRAHGVLVSGARQVPQLHGTGAKANNELVFLKIVER